MSMRDSSIVAGQLAGDDGVFSLTELPFGRYRLQVNFMGYAPISSESIMLSPRTTTSYDAGTIALSPRINALEEAVVVEEASSLEMLIDRRVFKVGNDLSAAGGTASELLVNVPSVAVDIDGNVSLRGSSQVQILIDGRPSGLTGAAQNAFLEQIPASSIDRVEVITNPSAKYDPDGMAGILNIILKKNKLQGFHGQAQATPGTGGNHNASLSLNYKNEKFSVFSSASWNHRDMFRAGETYRELTGLDSSSFTDQVRDGNQLRTSLNGRLGMEWYPSSSEVIGWNVNVNQNDRSYHNLLENRRKNGTPALPSPLTACPTKVRMDKDGTWTATTARSSTTTPSTCCPPKSGTHAPNRVPMNSSRVGARGATAGPWPWIRTSNSILPSAP